MGSRGEVGMSERSDDAGPSGSKSGGAGFNIQGSAEVVNNISGPEIVIAATTIGPFVTAFCTELGKRFGGTVADWTSRVQLRPSRGGGSAKVELAVTVDNAMAVLEIEESLPDEARLALLDLDDTGLLGHRLIWSAEAGKWVPLRG